MINLEDGLSLCGRCTCGTHAGYIISIGRREYTIRWLDGAITSQLRPDVEDDEQQAEAA
jgi:hypothetical protein